MLFLSLFCNSSRHKVKPEKQHGLELEKKPHRVFGLCEISMEKILLRFFSSSVDEFFYFIFYFFYFILSNRY